MASNNKRKNSVTSKEAKGSAPAGSDVNTTKQLLDAAAASKAVPEVKAAATAKATPAAAVPEVKAAPVAAATVTAVATAAKAEAGRDRTAIVALINKLHDVEADTARDAAAMLGALPVDAGAVDALIQAVRNSDGYFHPVVRAAAAAALGTIGDRRAVDALIHATRDPMAEASQEAVHALGLLGDRRALPALEAAVQNADGFFLENVRQSAREAIQRIQAAK